MATMTAAPRLTAAQVILLAGDDLMAGGVGEFSEWDLTIASWARDRTRFGLRGYDQKYPDHKRVMMEIMGQKPQNPITLGLMEKVRPNVYRLKPLGRAEAARLRSGGGVRSPAASLQTDLYRMAATLVNHPTYHQWKQDPDQPRRWADAATFLANRGDPTVDPAGCLAAVRRTDRSGIDWCMTHNVLYLTPTARSGGDPIHISELNGVGDFLQVLEYRFERQLASTRSSSRHGVKV